MAESNEMVRCLILALKNENVIVPNAAVAEIVPAGDVREIENTPDWMLGYVEWRGQTVPLMSFEVAGGDESYNITYRTQVAIIYAVSDVAEKRYPYAALVMYGIPRVSRFAREQIHTADDQGKDHPLIAQRVIVEGREASVLDIDAIESMLNGVAP